MRKGRFVPAVILAKNAEIDHGTPGRLSELTIGGARSQPHARYFD
jgi:hypothetical protein